LEETMDRFECCQRKDNISNKAQTLSCGKLGKLQSCRALIVGEAG
jgi:hypothetical protein